MLQQLTSTIATIETIIRVEGRNDLDTFVHVQILAVPVADSWHTGYRDPLGDTQRVDIVPHLSPEAAIQSGIHETLTNALNDLTEGLEPGEDGLA